METAITSEGQLLQELLLELLGKGFDVSFVKGIT